MFRKVFAARLIGWFKPERGSEARLSLSQTCHVFVDFSLTRVWKGYRLRLEPSQAPGI